MRVSALAAVIAFGALTLPAQAADSDITVDPLVGAPDTAFHVEVPAKFPIRQLRDRYWFTLHGPGGRHCEATVTDRVGITPTRRAKVVAVDLPGVRIVNSRRIVPGDWCVGTFHGRVEFRDWRPRTHRYVLHRIGRFAVQVQARQ
jgi:hypothetical protein